MDDDDEPLGGGTTKGYSAAVAYEESRAAAGQAYNPYGGDKIPANGIESKPLYNTTVIQGGAQGGGKKRKRKGGG